jgi:hypothetical protein
MQTLPRLIPREVKFPALAGAALVLAPLIIAASITGQPIWLRAGLVTISTFIGMQRAGLAPLGVLLHGVAIITGFIALLCTLTVPALFVFGCAIMAAGSILLTAKGEKLRSLGNFTFIPALYLACETSENMAAKLAIRHGIAFLPFAALALLPSLAYSIALHFRKRDRAQGYLRHMRQLSRHIDLGEKKPWLESAIVVALAVMAAASLVEWRHLANGQWVIWSAASVVTGNYASTGIKLLKRGTGALIGVPLGILFGQLLPHDLFAYDLTVLAATLTLVAFNRYIVGFASRCMFIAMAFIAAGESVSVAAERVVNVIIGGLIGYAFVFAIHALEQMRTEKEAAF